MVSLGSITRTGPITVRHAGEQHRFVSSTELIAFERMLRGQVAQARRTHWTTRAYWGHFLRSLLAFEPTNSTRKLADLFCVNRSTIRQAIRLADLCVDPASGVLRPSDLIQAIKSTAIKRRRQARDAMRRTRSGGQAELAAMAASNTRTDATVYPTVGGGTVVPPDQHAHKARLGDSINPHSGDGTMVPPDQDPDEPTPEQLDRMSLREVEVAAGIRPERSAGRGEPDLSLSHSAGDESVSPGGPRSVRAGEPSSASERPGGTADSPLHQPDHGVVARSVQARLRGEAQLTLEPLYERARSVRAAIVRMGDAQLASLIAEGLIGGELLRRLEETPVEPGALGDTPTLAFRGS